LFGGVTQIEVLARLAGLSQTNPHDIARETFANLIGAGADVEEGWKKYLHDGFVAEIDAKPVSAGVDAAAFFRAGSQGVAQAAAPNKGSLDVVFFHCAKVDDGRYNNNGWL